MESLENRIVLDGTPFLADFADDATDAFSGTQYFMGELNHTFPQAQQDSAEGDSGGAAAGAVGQGAHGGDSLTFVLDFNDPGQANTTDIFGNSVSTFDVASFGFTAAEFDAVAQSILDQVEVHFYEPPTDPLSIIPLFHQLDVDFVIGDVGVAPPGITEYYYIQIGTKTGQQGFLGVAGGSVVRDAQGNGPNFGVQIGDVVGTVLTDNIQGLGGVGNALSSGDLVATTNAIAGTTSHEIGHTVSLLHMNKAGVTTPQGSPPIMGTGAIDLPNTDRILRREFSLTGQNGEAANATQRHVDQLTTAIGTRLVTRNEVNGVVFLDANENGVQEAGELGVPNLEVFYDVNANGVLDTDEAVTTTLADGSYTLIDGLGVGPVEVMANIPPGLLPTVPADASQAVTFSLPIEVIGGIDFGVKLDPAQISGFKWIDADLDGRYDEDTELPGAGFRIYLDLNNNERPDIGEPSAVTDENGNYSIPSPGAGTYFVREATPPGFTMTFPNAGFHTVTVADEESAGGLNFGNSGQLHDFGNAPDSYGTKLADDGARHRLLGNFGLGATVTGEMDAVTQTPADNDGSSVGRLVAGQTGTLTVEPSTGGQTPGYVHAWVDFDQNGTFDADERIVANDRRGDGTHDISFQVPADAASGATWARVRYGWEFNLGATGESFAGEVEDIAINVVGDEPQAVDDLFDDTSAVEQDSANNVLDVLANDFASTAGPISVHLVQGSSGPATTTQGGTVRIAAGGQSVLYTPQAGFFGVDTFTYTIIDPSNNTSQANVTVIVEPSIPGPVALDDVHFFTDFPLNPSTDIPVLINDFIGPNSPIRINQITQQGNLGTAVINGEFITYTPNDVSAEGMTDVIEYEIIDQANNTSTAEVLVQIGNATANDDVQITLVPYDAVTGLPINTIQAGNTFELRAFIADIRAPRPMGTNGEDFNGMFSGYFDVTVNKPSSDSLIYAATFLGQPDPTANYPVGVAGDTLQPGQVNEAGGVQPVQIDGQVQGHGLGPIHIWTQTVRADVPGNLIFQPNPSDDDDLLTLFFDPPDEAPVDVISFLPASLIVTAGSGEGEGYHNLGMAGDVDGNGRINARDPLLLINKFAHAAEGEEADGIMWDVVKDGAFRLNDVMAGIAYFRFAHAANHGSGEGEGVLRGEGEGYFQPLDSSLQSTIVADMPSSSSIVVAPLANADDQAPAASSAQTGGVVLSTESEVDTQYYAEKDDESLFDRDWKVDLDSTLDDDLLESIADGWKD